MALARTPSSEWIQEGFRALAEGGPDAVRIEAVARRLGVTKGSFYWHFADRRALLDEMLAAWERIGVDDVVEFLEGAGGDSRAKLRRLFELVTAAGGMSNVELAIRDWARRDAAVAERLRRVDNRRMEYMRTLFRDLCSADDDVEARCVLALSLFVGSHFTAADHGGRSRPEAMLMAAMRLLV
jgi:AcrR family transcriptional regulator